MSAAVIQMWRTWNPDYRFFFIKKTPTGLIRTTTNLAKARIYSIPDEAEAAEGVVRFLMNNNYRVEIVTLCVGAPHGAIELAESWDTLIS